MCDGTYSEGALSPYLTLSKVCKSLDRHDFALIPDAKSESTFELGDARYGIAQSTQKQFGNSVLNLLTLRRHVVRSCAREEPSKRGMMAWIAISIPASIALSAKVFPRSRSASFLPKPKAPKALMRKVPWSCSKPKKIDESTECPP